VGTLNRSAFGGLGLKGLPLKPDLLKGNKIVSSLDDSVETKRHLEVLGDMPAVDMTMADEEAGIGDLEVDDDDEDANRIDAEAKAKAQAKAQNAMDVDEDDDVDPLDAFMDGVKDEVKKVNAEDLKKMVGSGRLPERGDDRMNEAGADDDDGEVEAEDELDATDLNPEDILALAAKKARKKDLAAVDHNKIKYEPFRKEFYVPPPEVAAMSDEEADLLRLELDSIKIRGVECPRPVTKWSHFGLHANVYAFCFLFLFRPCSLLFQFGCYQATELHGPNVNPSPSDPCHHVWPRRHRCSQDRLWKDHCIPSSRLPSYQGSAPSRADGRADGNYHDPNS
jgi:ATP-dependent RNA helicase DDX46/PRP5